MSSGGAEALAALLALSAEQASPRIALYEAFSAVLSGAPQMKPFRLLSLRQELGVELDAVDRAVFAFCLGDVATALDAIHALPASGRHRSRVLLWRAFFTGRSALDAGIHGVPGPVAVVQFWDAAPPPDVLAAMELWRDVAGDRYARFDQGTGREVVAAADIPGLVTAYDRAWHPAMKSDIFRLAWLFLHGGLYIDADMRPARALDAFLPTASRQLHLTFYAHMPGGRLQNSVMLAAPGHPLLRAAIDRCIRNVLHDDVRVPAQATGPAVLTNCLVDLLEAGPVPATMMAYADCQRRLATDFRPSYKTSEKSWQVAVGRA
jgi:hypothetical protein